MDRKNVLQVGLTGFYINWLLPESRLFQSIIYRYEALSGFRVAWRRLMEKKDIVIYVSNFFHEMILSWDLSKRKTKGQNFSCPCSLKSIIS